MNTVKQKAILNLINKLNKTVFTPNDIYQIQGSNKPFTKKAIGFHLIGLVNTNQISRIKRGQYMTQQTMSNLQINQDNNNNNIKPINNQSKKEDLPSFLAHEDIEKLLAWKLESINNTNQQIETLQLKINKLKKQKEVLNNIKAKFC